MAMQVESPPTASAKEPMREDKSLHVNAKRASWSPSGRADPELLSPVSKLQLARKLAAEEQQQRIDAACLRMVEAKKQKSGGQTKRVVHVETTTTTTTSVLDNADGDQEDGEGVIRSIARRFSSVFKSSTSAEQDPEEKYSPTRELLRATRDRLQSLVSSKKVETTEDAEGLLPSTNYHLKQLGLTNGKINIYAPAAEQQSELRRHRKSALACREKFLQDKTGLDDGYDSAEDSDFHADENEDEVDDDQSESVDNEEDDDEDGEEAEEVDMDPDEVEQLLRDRDQFLGIKPRRASKKKARRLSVGIPVFLLSFIVLLVALVLAADQAQQRLGWCTGSDRTSFLCTSLLQTQQVAHNVGTELQRMWPL